MRVLRAARPSPQPSPGGRGSRTPLALAALLLAAAAPPPGAASCSGCHGPAALPIAGQDAAALEATMLAYRDGERPSTLMGRLMKPLSSAEIAAIAAWVSVQPP